MRIIIAICLATVLVSCKVKPPQTSETNNISNQESSKQLGVNAATITSSNEEVIKSDAAPREDQLKELRPVK